MWFKNKNYLLVLLLPLSHTMGLRSSVQDESIFHRVHGYRVPLLKKLKEKEHDMKVCKIGEFFGDEQACWRMEFLRSNRECLNGREELNSQNNEILIETSPEDAERYVAALAKETDSNIMTFGKEDEDDASGRIGDIYSRKFHDARDLAHSTGKVTILHLKGMHDITPREKRRSLAANGWIDISEHCEDPSIFIVMSTTERLSSMYGDLMSRLHAVLTIEGDKVMDWFEPDEVRAQNKTIHIQNLGITALNVGVVLSAGALLAMAAWRMVGKSAEAFGYGKVQFCKLLAKLH